MLKKNISIVIGAAILFAAAPTSFGAFETEGDYEYRITLSATAEITKYLGNDTSLILPDTLGVYKVDRIGMGAFKDSNVKSITLSDNMTSLYLDNFMYWDSLTEINAKESNEGYSSIDGVLFSKDKTELRAFPRGRSGAYTVPEGTNIIGSGSFSNCNSLTSVTIPEGVTVIKQEAFKDCIGLISVEIPEGVTAINSEAFSNCRSMTSAELPKGITDIGAKAFYNCTSLKDIRLPEGIANINSNTFYHTKYYDNNKNWDGDLLYLDGYLLDSRDDITAAEVRDGTTVIAHGALFNRNNLTSLTLPASLTQINGSAVSSCEKLKEIYYSGTVDQWNKIVMGTIGSAPIPMGMAIHCTDGDAPIQIIISSVLYKNKSITVCAVMYDSDHVLLRAENVKPGDLLIKPENAAYLKLYIFTDGILDRTIDTELF